MPILEVPVLEKDFCLLHICIRFFSSMASMFSTRREHVSFSSFSVVTVFFSPAVLAC